MHLLRQHALRQTPQCVVQRQCSVRHRTQTAAVAAAGDEWWSRAMSPGRAAAAVQLYDQRTGDTRRGGGLGRSMPSTVMRGAGVASYDETRRRRQQQGRRAQVLAAVDGLRTLVLDDPPAARLFSLLAEIDALYAEQLRDAAPALRLRAGTSLVVDGVATAVGHNTRPQTAPRLTRWRPSATCPSFVRCTEADPVAPSWVDYLVGDLGVAATRALLTVVANAKVRDAAPGLRPCVEEALVFAMARRGWALDVVAGSRACSYFLRRRTPGLAHVHQVQVVWHRLAAQLTPDGEAYFDLRFKRWNNVASQLARALARHPEEAWRLLAQWHAVWTGVMRRVAEHVPGHPLAPVFRRRRPPGGARVHELTLDAASVAAVLRGLLHAGHPTRAVELLALALGPFCVRPTPALFNALLARLPLHLSSASASPLPPLLPGHQGFVLPADPHAQLPAVLRAMRMVRVVPDRRSLEIVARACCRVNNAHALCEALRFFASEWRVLPDERCWRVIGACPEVHRAARAVFEREIT